MPNTSARRALGRRNVTEKCGTQEVQVPCPTCEELVSCLVQQGTWDGITEPCVNRCHLLRHFNHDLLEDRAVMRALSERHEVEHADD